MAGNLPYTNFSETEWERLGDNGVWGINFVPRPTDDGDPTPIAIRIFNSFSIPYNAASASILEKGTLPGYDIHNLDALTAVRLSLLEELSDDPPKLVEVYVNADGEAEFINVGADVFSPTPLDVRYAIPMRRLVNKVDQVAITGFNPPSMVYVRGPYDLLEDYDASGVQVKTIMDPLDRLVNNTCYEDFFKRYALITYKTPILRSEWNDLLDSVYNVQAFERIIGWITNISADYVNEDTEIIFSDTTLYPVEFDAGAIQDVKVHYVEVNIDDLKYDPRGCDVDYSYIDFPKQDAIKINFDKFIDPETGQEKTDFLSIDQVFIIGWKAVATDWTAFGSHIGVNIVGPKEAVTLTENLDYMWITDDDGDPLISFIVREYSYEKLGTGYYLYGPRAFYSYIANTVYEFSGPSVTDIEGATTYNYNGESGWLWKINSRDGIGPIYFVDKIVVVARRQRSSITVYDPKGNADAIANSMKYLVYPIIECDPPAPVCGAGTFTGTVDPTTCLYDHDPTTFQDLTHCDSTKLQDALSGPSVSLTLPFLNGVDIDISNTTVVRYLDSNESPLCRVANFIYDLVNYDEAVETTYILGPNAEPKLGQSYNGGIINSISYSFSDSSSYLITITVGTEYLNTGAGFSQASIWQMDVENITREGTVTQVAGNGIHYVVHVDGLGDYIAVNTVFGQLPPEVGDKVTIEINNVPQGWR